MWVSAMGRCDPGARERRAPLVRAAERAPEEDRPEGHDGERAHLHREGHESVRYLLQEQVADDAEAGDRVTRVRKSADERAYKLSPA